MFKKREFKQITLRIKVTCRVRPFFCHTLGWPLFTGLTVHVFPTILTRFSKQKIAPPHNYKTGSDVTLLKLCYFYGSYVTCTVSSTYIRLRWKPKLTISSKTIPSSTINTIPISIRYSCTIKKCITFNE